MLSPCSASVSHTGGTGVSGARRGGGGRFLLGVAILSQVYLGGFGPCHSLRKLHGAFDYFLSLLLCEGSEHPVAGNSNFEIRNSKFEDRN